MSTPCYLPAAGDQIRAVTGYAPCGQINTTNPVVTCCAPRDICFAGGICHYTHSLEGIPEAASLMGTSLLET